MTTHHSAIGQLGNGFSITDGVIDISGGSATFVQRSLEGVVYETSLM